MDSRRPILTGRHYGWLTLAFVVFVIYGSLVPLHFQRLFFNDGWRRFISAFEQPVRINHRGDWLANILLFIPLGFLAMGWRCVDRSRRRAVPAFLLFMLCGLFSAVLEWVQLWFPPRNTTPNDVVAETLGAVIGIAAWLTAGQGITHRLRRFWDEEATQSWAMRLIPGYLILLVFIHGMPFDLTLGLGNLRTKRSQSLVLPFPFTAQDQPLDIVKQAILNAAWFLPAGILIAGLPYRRLRSPGAAWRVLGIGFALSSSIEILQLFVMSRTFDTTDILTGSLAVLGGWRLMRAWQDRGAEDNLHAERFPAAARRALLLVWIVAVTFINWEPFDFQTDASFIPGRWRSVRWLPFADYWKMNYLLVVNEIVQRTFLFIPFGLLVSSGEGARSSPVRVVVAAFALALVLEIGQFFLRGHQPGISDLIVEPIGAWLGWRLARRLRGFAESHERPLEEVSQAA